MKFWITRDDKRVGGETWVWWKLPRYCECGEYIAMDSDKNVCGTRSDNFPLAKSFRLSCGECVECHIVIGKRRWLGGKK